MAKVLSILILLLATIALINAQTSIVLSPAGNQLNACQTNLTLLLNPISIAIAPSNGTLISRSYTWFVNSSNIVVQLPNSVNATSLVVNLRTLLTFTQYLFGVNVVDLISLTSSPQGPPQQVSQFIWAPYSISVFNGTQVLNGTAALPVCNNPVSGGIIGNASASVKNDAHSHIVYGGVLYHVTSSVVVLFGIGLLMMVIDSLFY